jgi:hypothetical protein
MLSAITTWRTHELLSRDRNSTEAVSSDVAIDIPEVVNLLMQCFVVCKTT